MFTKVIFAITTAIVLGNATGALAAKKHSTNPTHDVYVNGQYIGSDPDSRIRSDLARGSGVYN